MSLGIQTGQFGGDGSSPPPRYRVKGTNEDGSALGTKNSPGQVTYPMYCGSQPIEVVYLLMDDTREVRTYAEDALENLD